MIKLGEVHVCGSLQVSGSAIRSLSRALAYSSESRAMRSL
jgi:hypothetical protein